MSKINMHVEKLRQNIDELILKSLEAESAFLASIYLKTIQETILLERNQEIKQIIKYIFNVERNGVTIKPIKDKMKNYGWLNIMVTQFIKSLSLLRTDFQLFYNSCCHLFGIYYEEIKTNFGAFYETLKNENIKRNIYSLLISFFAFCNEQKFVLVAKDINKNEKLKLYEDIYNNNMKAKLCQTIKNYCDFYEIGIYGEIIKNKEEFKETLQNELNEFNCFVEVFKPEEEIFRNFFKSFYYCIGEKLRPVYLKKSKAVNNFIDSFFETIIGYFKIDNFWNDENMLIMYEDINEYALQNASFEGNENYLDFIICYKYKYNIQLKDFITILIKGLKNEKLNEIFVYANNTIDNFGNIDDKENIELLVEKLSKKKRRKKTIKKIKQNEINSNDNNISIALINENKEDINNETYSLDKNIINKDNFNLEQNLKTNNIDNNIVVDEKITDENEEKVNISFESDIINKEAKIKDTTISENINIPLIENPSAENKYDNNLSDYPNREEFDKLQSLVQNQNEKIQNQDQKIQNQDQKIQTQDQKIKNQNEKIQDLQLLVQNLRNEDKKKSTKLERLQKRYSDQNSKIFVLNMRLQRISYRDISKIVLNKMIDYVNKKAPNLLKDINGRKKKLEKIIEGYNFNDISFMKDPINEIKNKYYNSNDYSHVPKLLKQYREEPYGMNKIKIEDIIRNYCEVMVGSKSEQVYLFLKNEFQIENEAKNLYKL